MTPSTSSSLNDASLVHEPENSEALGFGFRCGFLGLLHLEIVQERLEREFNIDLITTAPSVRYRIKHVRRERYWRFTRLPSFRVAGDIEKVEEPIILVLRSSRRMSSWVEFCRCSRRSGARRKVSNICRRSV